MRLREAFRVKLGLTRWRAQLPPLLVMVLLAHPLQAAAPTAVAASRTLRLDVSGGQLIQLPAIASTVFIADPAIADVQTPSASSVFVFGKKPGRTTLFVLTHAGAPLAAYTLDVRYPETQAQALFRGEAGDAPVQLVYTANGVLLEGTVPDAATADRLLQVAARTVGSGILLTNQLRIAGPAQVNLRVRVAEVSRTVSRTLGFNWSTMLSTGSFALGLQTGRFTQAGATTVANGIDAVTGSVKSSNFNGSAVLDAMATEGLVSMLAEPNLTAVSGATATFLAGGEIPVPVPQALGVTSIEYKQFGVSISFAPTVLSSGRISMRVRPEVSEIDATDSVSVGGVQVPGFTTRRAETTVDLASGQSFAIAGLIQNNSNNNVQKLPWLGDIPVLGALFRSTQFQHQQTELVIVVTPYVVHPVGPDTPPVVPTGFAAPPSDLQTLLFGRLATGSSRQDSDALRGPAGFLLE